MAQNDSKSSVICCGRLCRAAAIGRTVTGQPRRAAISRMWPARAPQATISMRLPIRGAVAGLLVAFDVYEVVS